MARVEGSVDSVVRIFELCDHIMCSCKNSTGEIDPRLAVIEKTIITEDSMSTPVTFEFADGQKQLHVFDGVVTRDRVAEEFTRCEGPVITNEGIVCGAIDSLRRKRSNGR
jgi:hypothetical protein